MNNIYYLSIATSPYSISYSIFKGKNLYKWGIQNLTYLNYEVETFDFISKLINENSIDVVLTKQIEFERHLKKDIQKLSEFQTIIKLSALKNNALYSEFRTFGWEKRLLFNRITTKQKIETINFAYDIDLKNSEVNVANSIILGEGVAHNRLQIGSLWKIKTLKDTLSTMKN